MARPPILSRLRRKGPALPPAAETPSGDAAGTAPRRRPLPPPGRLRRERRALVRQREERIRDLGGLVLEMYRRDDYRQELVDERCAELAALDERLYELDALLRVASARRRPAARCACGAPFMWGSWFCGTCGRPVGEPGGIVCETCGSALQVDARFCPVCGAGVGPATEPAPSDEPTPAEPLQNAGRPAT
jgi:hypothetical protein